MTLPAEIGGVSVLGYAEPIITLTSIDGRKIVRAMKEPWREPHHQVLLADGTVATRSKDVYRDPELEWWHVQRSGNLMSMYGLPVRR